MKNLIWILFFLSNSLNLSGQVTPLPLAHSHNDYDRPNPLEDALANGFTSVEADILFIYGKLYVGHNMPKKKRHNLKTLTRQYLKPLYRRYKKNNGAIYVDYDQAFYLWIDIKFEPHQTYKKLREILYPFREMLNYYENGQLHKGPITVILSGERPFQLLLNDSLQLMTLDGRPSDLRKNYPSHLMPFISENAAKVAGTDDYSKVGEAEWLRIKAFIDAATAQGKKTRLWATPEKEQLWEQLLVLGIDLINTDDLSRLRKFLLEAK